jgi:hypothetical protein
MARPRALITHRHPAQVRGTAYARVQDNYLKSQNEIVGQVLPGQRPRSVVFRTARLLRSVMDSLELDEETDTFPELASIREGSAGTWRTSWQVSAAVVEASQGPDLWLAQRVVTALLRDLTVNRPGDLNLALVEPAVSRSARPDVIWSAVVRFIAQDPTLRASVETVTSRWHTDTGVKELALPPAVLELIHFETDAPPDQLARPARLRQPGSALDPSASESGRHRR